VPIETPQRAIIGTPFGPIARRRQRRSRASAGLAIRLGVKERVVRIIFCLWRWSRASDCFSTWCSGSPSREWAIRADCSTSHRRHRKLNSVVIGIIAIVAIFFFLDRLATALGVYSWPIFLTLLAPSACGAGVVRRAGSSQRSGEVGTLHRRRASKKRWSFWLRLALGVIFIVFGLRILDHWEARGPRDPAFIGTLVLIGGS